MDHENLPPKGHVQAFPTVIRGDRIKPGVQTTVLCGGNFPAVTRALNLIREDSGGPSWPAQRNPIIAARWVAYLTLIETAIGKLADDAPAVEDHETCALVADRGKCHVLDSELYAFCNGEHDVKEAIAARSMPLRTASNFLDDFFEGWGLYQDSPFDPSVPRN